MFPFIQHNAHININNNIQGKTGKKHHQHGWECFQNYLLTACNFRMKYKLLCMLGFFMKVYNSELFPGFLACLLTIGNKAVLKLKNMPTYFIKSSVYQIDWSSRTNFLVLQGLCTTKLVLPRLRPLFMNDNLVKPLAKPRCL